ncbi:hypothetical protein M569_15944, partial [Genlisea aurea]
VYNIVFVTTEASPYSKTGGLGDVCGSLPIVLAGRGHRVMVVSPRYLNGDSSKQAYANAVEMEEQSRIYCFGGEHEIRYYHEFRAGVDWVFVDHVFYHRPGTPYRGVNGLFQDNQLRFALLCYAASEAPLVLRLGGNSNSVYGEKTIFVANDWHSGLVPVLLAAKYRPRGVYTEARCVFVIHNMAYQGMEFATAYKNLGLPNEWHLTIESMHPKWARSNHSDEPFNFLKSAIAVADRIVTVSQIYSREITTPKGGYGLHKLLKSRNGVLTGITNGIDDNEWNPSTDKFIASTYSIDNLSGKIDCKIALQKELGFPVRPDLPLIGFVGRLDYQKGIDILLSTIPDIMKEEGVQLVMMGSGDAEYEKRMQRIESSYPDKYRGRFGFEESVYHRIIAGCDILAMPSRFEPCGLVQLHAMRYGTVPVVHSTGGLRETVSTFDPESNGEGTGWVFSPLNKDTLIDALRTAVHTYETNKPSWEGLMKRGMERKSSWDEAADRYERVFELAFGNPPY